MNIPNDAHYTVRIDGQGEIAIRGTAEFVNAHAAYATKSMLPQLQKWVEAQRAAGRSDSEIQAELDAALDRATDQARAGAGSVDIKAGTVS